MNPEQLKKILEKHALWLAGMGGERANLWGANLGEADLQEANLRGANLWEADLQEANLQEANLGEANLWGANLRGAKVSGVKWPAPTMVLLSHWGKVSDNLCRDLMRFDASNHPDPSLFDMWKETGKCPYDGCAWERSAYFRESRDLWSPGLAPSALSLAERLIAECCDKGE